MQAQSKYEHGTEVNYNFPVKLVDLYTKDEVHGSVLHKVPNAKAVFREDEHRPIAAVSNRYKLITHEEVLSHSDGFMKKIGNADVVHTLDKEGARVLSEYTFKNRTVDIGRGDVMALRAYVENSYDGTKSARIRLGAWRMICSNGMIIGKTAIDLAFRHIGNNQIDWSLAFPKPELILDHFTQEGKKWERYSNTPLGIDKAIVILDRAEEEGVLAEKTVGGLKGDITAGVTFWDIYNMFTQEITHNVRAKSYINRINRLEKVSRWMDKAYAEL